MSALGEAALQAAALDHPRRPDPRFVVECVAQVGVNIEDLVHDDLDAINAALDTAISKYPAIAGKALAKPKTRPMRIRGIRP